MRNRGRLGMVVASLLLFGWGAARGSDPYEQYITTSRDFQRVRQEKAWCLKAWPSWTYMPWTYKWTIGYTKESGAWAKAHGYNGAFIDWDRIESESSKTGKLDWINEHGLRFYVDHLAAKRYLHLWDGNEMKPHAEAVHGGGVRIKPANRAMAETLKGFIRKHIGAVKASPWLGAYSLDDEISWGHFVHPCMWQVTDEAGAYARWLKEVYGPAAPKRDRWVTYGDILPKLKTWTIGTFDASPLMDQWTFNDAYWANFIGDLVEYSNSVDPQTPCGFAGGQAPNAFGGYDYARLMRKVQFIEAYNLGSSQAIIRSLNRGNALPTVTTHFHKSTADTIWQVWYYLAQGNRGFIGWVEGWFDGKEPRAWHKEVGPHYREAAERIGPLMSGAEWRHDGVAIYYSHPSIQLSWILDAEAHGKTWVNRNGDHKLGSSHHVRHAWENMLRDSGVQFSYLSYVDVVERGIPGEYKVLILPGCLCLSDAEARRIRAFCEAGGTVIADYLPGVWDPHGKGRSGGVLDAMFGVRHEAGLKAGDVFGGKLWCEVDQDANYSWKTYEQFLTNRNTCIKDASGFYKVVRAMGTKLSRRVGKGTAVLMNLSPQWYNVYRVAGFEAATKRAVFMEPVGVKRWVQIKGAGEREHGYEITYWRKAGRTILFLCQNPDVAGSETGGGHAKGLKTETVDVTLAFARPIKDVRDERTGKALGTRREFPVRWAMNEAVVLSFSE